MTTPTPQEFANKLNIQLGKPDQNSYSGIDPFFDPNALGVFVRTQNDGEPHLDNKGEPNSGVVGAFLHNSINVPGMAGYPYQGTKKFNAFNVDGVRL